MADDGPPELGPLTPRGPAGPASGGIWAPQRRAVTVGLVTAVTLVAFEALAIATVLPVVGRHLGDIRLYGWVFSAFMLTSLVGIVVAGTLSDRAHLGRPMSGGLVLFAVGLIIGGTAPDMPVLVVGRAVQGLGAGVVPAVAYVAISRCYPERSQPRMFALLSTAWVVPGVSGPAIATLIASAAGWRWVFLGLLPLVLVTGVLTALTLRGTPLPPRPNQVVVPYAAVGAVVVGAGTALASLSSGQWPFMVVAVPAGAALLLLGVRRLTPPGTMVAAPGLPATILSRGLLTCCFFGGDIYVPYTITTVRHSPMSLAALALTDATMAWTVGAWAQARYIAEIGPRRFVRGGECLVIVGLGLMALVLLPSVPPQLGVVAWTVAGGGMGLAYAPLSVTMLDSAEPGREGEATASLQLFDVLGQAVGSGLAGALVAASGAADGHRDGVGVAFAVGGAIGLVALSTGARLPRFLSTSRSTPRRVGAAGPVT